MRCVICKQGELKSGAVTATLQRGETTIIIKGVPADVCEKCGEYFLTDEVTKHLLSRADEAVQKGAEMEILKYAA